MNEIFNLDTAVEAIRRRDRTFFDQFDAEHLKENPPVEIQWSFTYDKSHLNVEWDIKVLLTGGHVDFIVCDLTQGEEDIAYRMDSTNTDITVVKQGNNKGWLNVAYNPVQPVEVKATIFGYANAPRHTSQVFKFEKTIKIE